MDQVITKSPSTGHHLVNWRMCFKEINDNEDRPKKSKWRLETKDSVSISELHHPKLKLNFYFWVV